MSAPTGPPIDPSPWYRHFWPWFIVILLGTSVVAGLTTLWIAIVNRDSLVSDEWYKDGKAINRRLEKIELARHLGVGATIDLDPETGQIDLRLAGRDLGALPALTLELSHPTLAEKDQRIQLRQNGVGHYSGSAKAGLQGRWYAMLEPTPEPDGAASWRLMDRIVIPSLEPIHLGATP